MSIWQKIQTALRFFGLKITVQTIQYSLVRDWLEFRYRRKVSLGRPQKPGGLQMFQRTERGGIIEFERARLEVAFLDDGLAQIHWMPGVPPIPYAIEEQLWPLPGLESEEVGKGVRFRTAALTVSISEDGAIEYSGPQGELLSHQLPPVLRGERWTQPGPLAEDERIYGLGERAAPLNLRGGRYRLWNQDPGGSYGPASDPLYMGIPVYLGLHARGSYLIFYENPFPGEIAFSSQVVARFDGGALRYYFIAGPPDRALADYSKLTGRPPLPPRWALGYHQSRWGYKTEQQVREIVEGFRRHDLPLDALHLDIDYMHGFRLFTVDKSRFPDLARLAEDLQDVGVRLVPILDCGIKQDPKDPVFEEGLAGGHFVKLPNGKPVKALVWPGWSVFPDFTDQRARAWWGENYTTLLEAGASGIWHDMNEPGTFAAWGEPSLPLVARHAMEGRGGSHREAHNLYGLLMGKAGFEALQRLRPDRRPWLLTRSGWAGIQRYAWHWTADTESTWEMLKQTVASLLGLSLSGIPYSGPDIGGFSGEPSPELFLRWFQLAAFVPFFRNHAAVGTPPREPWKFGTDILGILREFMVLRRRLVPYLYTLAWEASKSGQPLMRPLFWHNLEDQALWDHGEAFLLGRDLLVAPIFEPGARVRRQRLPAGEWFNFWDDTRYQGPAEVELPTRLEEIPVLIRAGTILPLLAKDRRKSDDPVLELHVYPSAGLETIHSLYSDSGDGYGDSRVDQYRIFFDGKSLEVRWHQQAGDYLFPYRKVSVRVHGFDTGKIWIDGKLIEEAASPVEMGYFETLKIELAPTSR